MTPDQSPGLGTNPTRYYTLIDGKLQLVDTHIWGIRTTEYTIGDEEAVRVIEFYASTPVPLSIAACTLSPDVRTLPEDLQRATWDL